MLKVGFDCSLDMYLFEPYRAAARICDGRTHFVFPLFWIFRNKSMSLAAATNMYPSSSKLLVVLEIFFLNPFLDSVYHILRVGCPGGLNFTEGPDK